LRQALESGKNAHYPLTGVVCLLTKGGLIRVRRGKCPRIRVPIWSLTLLTPNVPSNVFVNAAVEQRGSLTTGIRGDHSRCENRSKTSRWPLLHVNPRRAILVRHGLRTEVL